MGKRLEAFHQISADNYHDGDYTFASLAKYYKAIPRYIREKVCVLLFNFPERIYFQIASGSVWLTEVADLILTVANNGDKIQLQYKIGQNSVAKKSRNQYFKIFCFRIVPS